MELVFCAVLVLGRGTCCVLCCIAGTWNLACLCIVDHRDFAQIIVLCRVVREDMKITGQGERRGGGSKLERDETFGREREEYNRVGWGRRGKGRSGRVL